MGKKPLVLGLKGSKYQGVMFRLEEASSLKSTVRELVLHTSVYFRKALNHLVIVYNWQNIVTSN